MLHVGGHEGVVACASTLSLHVGAVVRSDLHVQRVLHGISHGVQADFFDEVVKEMTRLGLSGVFHAGGSGDEVVDGAGVDGVSLHVVGGVAHDAVA